MQAKKDFIHILAQFCATCFKASRYPLQAFDFPFHAAPSEFSHVILELHIRIPDLRRLPKALSFPEHCLPSEEQMLNRFQDCPAIENIQLHPAFQRHGFLNALMKELGQQGVPYVNISNIENESLALHFLTLSRRPGAGVELTSPLNTVTPEVFYPTFSVDLKERFGIP